MGQKRKRSNRESAATQPPSKKHNKTSSKSENLESEIIPLDTSPFVDNPTVTELKREVQAYEALSAEDEAIRLDAASAVILGLLGGDGVEEATLQRHLERRLFRGLASGRKAARLGYSAVITEVLRELFGQRNLGETKYKGLSFEKVLGFLVAKTKPDGDLSGQEERDHYIGLLFGLQSFVRANILFSDERKWFTILEKLFDLSKKKPWLQEECGSIIEKTFEQMNQVQAEVTLEKLYQAGLAMSPEGVGIWLTATKRFPGMTFPIKPWGPTGNPLDRLQSLAKALKEGATNDQTSTSAPQVKHKGNWNHQLHFVWDIVLGQFSDALRRNEKTQDIKANFANFWKVAIDDNLFSSSASRERKYWGFSLFQKVLQDSSSYANLFPYIFSRNLVRCLINHSQDTDRFLHRSAEKSLKVLLQTVESSPDTLVLILPGLISGNGVYNFDPVTKTKTVEKILVHVNAQNAKQVIEMLLAPVLIVEGSDAVEEANMRRIMLGDYLLNILRRADVLDDSTWVSKVALPILADFAYTSNLVCNPPISEKTRMVFRTRLMSTFAHFVSNLDGYSYPSDLVRSFTPDSIEMDKNITQAKDNALSILNKISKKSKKASDGDKAPLHALALLYSLAIFQLYNGEVEAVAILDELDVCYDKFVRQKTSDDADVDASEVLVELLLSLISKPSALLRRVAQNVFQAFLSNMTEGGLQLITDILGYGENLRGQQELFDQQPEEEENVEDEGNDSDEEMDSDVEVIEVGSEDGQLNGHLLDEEGPGDDSEDDDDADDDDDDEDIQNDEEVKRLNAALAKLYKTDEDQESDSDADMTDSEMMALDPKLIEYFSHQKKTPNKKQEQKEAKETMVNFKSRVLDLLEIYVKKQAASPLSLGLLLPLLKLIQSTQAKSLGKKACGIISTFSKASNDVNKEGMMGISIDEQFDLLRAIHLEARKHQSELFGAAAGSASLLVVSNLYRRDKGCLGKIVDVYGDTLMAWVTDEDVKLHSDFQIGWINWCQSKARGK